VVEQNAPGFIPFEQLPQITLQTSFRATFAEMSRKGVSGAITLDGTLPTFCLLAPYLRDVLFDRINEQGRDTAASLTLGFALCRGPLTPSKAGGIIRISPRQVRVADREAVLRESGAEEFDMFWVVDSLENTIGWQLRDAGLLAAILTRPPKFFCKNGHENADPDSNYCYKCPAEIITTA
jgi:hypothetical protein